MALLCTPQVPKMIMKWPACERARSVEAAGDQPRRRSPRHVLRDAAVADSRGGRERRRVRESFPRTILAEGDLAENDHLAIELVDPADTPQQVVVHWPTKATAVRPAAYGEAAAKAMRLLANADMELARLRARGRQPKVER